MLRFCNCFIYFYLMAGNGNMIKKGFRELLRDFHYDVVRFPLPGIKSRMKLMKSHNIEAVIDVGANLGQYAEEILYYGFEGHIYSFEPINSVFQKLQENAKKHDNWSVYNMALGERDGTAEINVTNQVPSSSLLEIKNGKINAYGGIYSVKTETIEVRTLDSMWDNLFPGKNTKNVLLKIDTQGYEKFVLAGCENVLPRIKGVQLEMSFKELYEGAWLYAEAMAYLAGKGFALKSLEPAFYDENSGELLEMDGIFYRENEEG